VIDFRFHDNEGAPALVDNTTGVITKFKPQMYVGFTRADEVSSESVSQRA
jgi:hypothetical protein